MSDGTWMLFYYNPDGARSVLKELEKINLKELPKLMHVKKILENFVENGSGNFNEVPDKE